jgi:mannosyltransferase
VALLLVLAALVVRLHRIDAQGLWADEGGTAGYASLRLDELVATIAAHDPHPPLYYILLALWLPLAGPSDFAIRLPSALFVTLAVAALYRLGRRIGGRGAATVAALFTAFNPLLVWYGQEARMYALLVLGATASTLLLHRARQSGSWRAWLGLAAALAATLHVHYFAAFLAGLHAALVERAVRWRPDRWRALAAFALVAAAFAPWVLTTDTLGYQGWMEPVDLATAARRAAWGLAVGTSIYPEHGWLLAAPTLAAGALGALSLLLRRPRADFLLVVGWVVAPVAAAYGFGAVTGRPSFHVRYVIASAPGLMLLAGLGVAAAAAPLAGLRRDLRLARAGGPTLRPVVAVAGVSGLLLASALTVGVLAADARSLVWHFADPHFGKEDVRGAAAFVDARAGISDGLVASPARAYLYNRYGKAPLGRLVSDVAPHEIEAALAGFVAGRPRLWYLPADAEVDRVAEAWLDGRAFRLYSRWFGLAPLKAWVFAPDPPGPGASAERGRAGWARRARGRAVDAAIGRARAEGVVAPGRLARPGGRAARLPPGR